MDVAEGNSWNFSRVRRAALLVALFGMISTAAACSSSGSGSSSSPGTSGSTSQAAAVLGPAKPATGSTVKIGFVTSEGGTSTNLSATREAAQAAAKYANDHLGGIAGHKIELETCADKGDGASATACANQFVSDKVIAVVVGQVGNPDLYIPILEGAKTPWVIETPAGAKESTSPISFDLTGGLIGQLAATAADAQKKGLKHLVLFGIDVPAFTAAFGAFGKPTFDKAGVTVDVVTIPPGTPDATPQVNAGMAKKPDGAVIVADDTLCKAILPALHAANTANVPLYFPDLCAGDNVIESVGKDVVDGGIINGTSVSTGTDTEATLYKAVMATYSPSTPIVGKGGAGYVAMLSLIRGVNQINPTGDLTAAVVLDAMHKAKAVPLPGFPDGATFTCDGSALPHLSAICTGDVLFGEVQDGKIVGYHTVDGSALLK
jgi:branched-chain amino acid transport system substrate-binding protein